MLTHSLSLLFTFLFVCLHLVVRPIHDAAEGGYVDVLRVLLSYGADPKLATYSGNSALTCTKDSNTRAFLEGEGARDPNIFFDLSTSSDRLTGLLTP